VLVRRDDTGAEPIGERHRGERLTITGDPKGRGRCAERLGACSVASVGHPHQRWLYAPMLMPPNVIAVTGLAFEARIAAGRGVNVLCATERSRLLEWLEASTAYECSGIISFGIAGGLDRRLSPGDWVVASSVVTDTGQFPADPSWARRLLSMVPGSIHAAISGVDAPLADPAAKLRLHQSHGTVAVDLESHVAARIATARNLPFAACRVILDPASRRLPPAALVPLCRDGTPDLGGVLRSLARDPIQVCGLLRIIVDAWSARSALKRDRKSLGDGLGFPLPMATCTESFTTGEAQAPGFLPMSSIARHA
jgi:hopanoid-associated phosphorylase